MATVVEKLDLTRELFRARLADGGVRHCDCGQEDCPAFMVTEAAAAELDTARRDALRTFGSVTHGFDVEIREGRW